uniref:Uncharacterized protein n=1 Tax=Triticum urartu TaxID=4572 RepID=A0A8R7PE21_TRIUA
MSLSKNHQTCNDFEDRSLISPHMLVLLLRIQETSRHPS